MKKLIIVGIFGLACSYTTYRIFARGGDSFVGGFAGGMTGSVVGSAVTQPRERGGRDSSGQEALRAVDRLEIIMRNDFTALNNRMNDFERRLASLEATR